MDFWIIQNSNFGLWEETSLKFQPIEGGLHPHVRNAGVCEKLERNSLSNLETKKTRRKCVCAVMNKD
jgi:hypothetical protein